MNKILVTGATGNVGKPLLRYLANENNNVEVFAGVRKNAVDHMPPGIQALHFDFNEPATFGPALQQCDQLFLLRPGAIANTTIMQQLVSVAKEANVKHIVFISVQGVDRMKWTPHYKTEKIIKESGIAYTFLRPAYFMQNFEGPLLKDLKERHRIFLPAGNALFTIIDVEDVAFTAAKVLLQPQMHRNKAYDLTNGELLSFEDMARIFSEALGRHIQYQSPGLLRFYLQKKKEGLATGFIFIIMALHYLPRFAAMPVRSNAVQDITGRAPASLQEYILRNAIVLR